MMDIIFTAATRLLALFIAMCSSHKIKRSSRTKCLNISKVLIHFKQTKMFQIGQKSSWTG